MTARRAVVEGVVQGVGFRWATYEAAGRLGVNGWVRNRSDGSVEAYLEGSEDSVEEMLDWLSRGPVGSVVTSLSVEVVAPEGGRGFHIRR